MKNPFITEIERTFNKSKVLNSKFQEIGDQPSILFDFLLNDAPQKGALFIAENDDFILLQIFVRYPHPIPSENVPQVLTALNGINSVSIAGFLMLTEDCLLYTSPSPRDRTRSRMPSSA